MAQSPIKLISSQALQLGSPEEVFKINYSSEKFAGCFEGEKGHKNFKFNKPYGPNHPEISFRGKPYSLAKIHLHRESEHLIDSDKPAAYEIHLIHTPKNSSVDSPLVVLGILYSEPTETRPLAQQFLDLCESLCKDQECTHIAPLDFFPLSAESMGPDLSNWFHYEGSLTSPPYSEDVSWFVLRDQGSVTMKEVEKLNDHAIQHRREPQPLDRRLVVRSFPLPVQQAETTS